MKSIKSIAKKLCIPEKELFYYGKYMAKINYNYKITS